MSDILRQNQQRIAKALAAERQGEPVSVDSDPDIDEKKEQYQAQLVKSFEDAKPMLDQTLAACKDLLVAGTDQAEVRKLVLEMVQTAKVHHKFTKIDDNYKVVRANNGPAADKIMECLLADESPEQVLLCVYSEVYWLTHDDDELAKLRAAGNTDPSGEPADEADGQDDSPKSDDEGEYITQLSDYLSYLAGEFFAKVEEVEIDGEHVLVPRAETVRLRQARSNGKWLISYHSILGEENNPWREKEGNKYQAQYDVVVRDQELAAATNPNDLDAVRQLILESVPRSDLQKGGNGKPRNYILMTSDDNEALKQDIARLLGLDQESTLLGWLRNELIKGAGADELRALLVEQQKKWAENDAQPKENLLSKRPVPQPPKDAPSSSQESNPERERMIESVRAFIRVQIAGLSREEALARKNEILERAKQLI